ncbi:MAG TPA: hypothetical protein PLB10_06670 [Thiolinea sp.]|nr:hypothetical protein [Thiolinea sp.]
MLDLVINFIFGLAIVGIPSYVFYRLGVDAGIQRGVRRQLLRELTMCGIIEKTEIPSGKYRNGHTA